MIAKKLQKGSTIGIVAPSKQLNENSVKELETFEKYVNELGLKVIRSKNLMKVDKYHTSAGTPKERAYDINDMFANKDVNAVWFFQGGDTANQTLEYIDFEILKKNPKILLGKSDIDMLLLAANKLTGLITFHCNDPKIGRNKEMDFDYTKNWFEKRLMDKAKEIEPSEKWQCIREGSAEGKIIGCNEITMLKLAGTKYFPDFTDAILFLEVYKGDPSTLLWELTQMKLLGVFEKIKGIVIGHNFQFDGGETNVSVEEIIFDFVEDLPILKVNEFGHYQPHAFLPIGAKVRMDATNKTLEIIEEFLE